MWSEPRFVVLFTVRRGKLCFVSRSGSAPGTGLYKCLHAIFTASTCCVGEGGSQHPSLFRTLHQEYTSICIIYSRLHSSLVISPSVIVRMECFNSLKYSNILFWCFKQVLEWSHPSEFHHWSSVKLFSNVLVNCSIIKAIH